MLTQLEVFNSRVATPPFPLDDGSPETDPIQIRNIDGLGPVGATINTAKHATIIGESFSGANVGKRNIVLTVGFNPDWSADQTVESLRKILYAYFTPQNKVRMRFTTSLFKTVQITGYVETCEPSIFSDEPEMQISIVCPSPYFVDVQPTILTGFAGAIGNNDPTIITNEGTVPTGFVLTVEKGLSPDYYGQIQVLNSAPDLEVFLVNSILINASEYFDMSTVLGGKYARKKLSTGVTGPNALNNVTQNSTWSQLQPGLNNFQVLTTAGGLPWTLRYFNRYGGL